MAKPWLLFSTGLVTGLALACGVYALRPTAPAPSGPAGDLRPKARSSTHAAFSENKPAIPAASPAPLAEKIALLQRWVDGLEPKLDRTKIQEILSEWSAADPKAALQFVMNAKRFPQRNDALAYPLAVLCSKDAASVINWLRQNRTEGDRGDTAIKIIELIQEKFPAQAWELALADGIPVREQPFSEALAAFARQQPQQALAAFAKLSPRDQKTVTPLLAEALYSVDPKTALAWYESLSPDQNKSETTLSLIKAAMKANDAVAVADLIKHFNDNPIRLMLLLIENDSANPQLIQALAANIPDPDTRQQALTAWARNNLERSPADALKTIRTLLPAADQVAALSRGFISWLNSDRSAAMAWLDSLDDPSLSAGLRKLSIKSPAQTDPKAFLAQIDDLGVHDPDAANNINSALLRVSNDDPATAADWITRHPGQAQGFIVNRVTDRYLDSNPAAATNWINTLPKGEVQDDALANAAAYWSIKNDLAGATKSMDAITDPSQRMATMYMLFNRLSQKDSASALRWAETQGLSEETRMTWLAIAKKGAAQGMIVD
ncbi:MAG: hypothetical protein JSS11_10795 [Verrucomicrobia bacterium]|nr:hypothetical protein [Verrucomicrobiota bacterium]